ncbi:MAG: LysR family transcriptional regulator [Paracoccaceae bacterium]
MSTSLPPLTWFRSFEAAARHLSFTAAADELGLTQSAISQQVRALETRLGAVLFVRKPRGLALTDDGRRLLPKIAAPMDQLAAATAEFETGPTEGLLTVATSVSIARWIIAPNLAGFQARHPGLRIRLIGTIWPDEFRPAMADVEIRFGSEKQVGQGAMRLDPDGLIAVATPKLAHSLGEGALIEAVGTSEGWMDWGRKAGIADLPAPMIFVDSYGAALDLAVHGVGVALTSSLLAQDVLAAKRVVRVGQPILRSTEGYFLALNSGSDASAAFAAWLCKIILPG